MISLHFYVEDVFFSLIAHLLGKLFNHGMSSFSVGGNLTAYSMEYCMEWIVLQRYGVWCTSMLKMNLKLCLICSSNKEGCVSQLLLVVKYFFHLACTKLLDFNVWSFGRRNGNIHSV